MKRTFMLRVGIGTLLAMAAMLGTCGVAACAGALATEGVWLQSNLQELYPRQSGVCVSTYQQMDDTSGVVLKLQSDVGQFSHYRYTLQRDALAREAPVESRNGAIAVLFDERAPDPQHLEIVVQVVSKSGQRTRPFSIKLGYYSRAHYAASAQKTKGWLVVQASDLALCGTSVADWIVERPTASDRAYARKRWGRLVAPLASDHEKAQAIARELVWKLRPHEGVPSDRMRFLSGLEQLARAEAGRDHVWCGNYADIFSAACNALDIPVRKIDMQYVWSTKGETNFEIAEGHRTTEVFDRANNRWIWMDLTLGFLGAHLDDREPLNMAELVQTLADDRRLERLRVVECDLEQPGERSVSVSESKRGNELFRFFRQDQHYRYARRSRTAGH